MPAGATAAPERWRGSNLPIESNLGRPCWSRSGLAIVDMDGEAPPRTRTADRAEADQRAARPSARKLVAVSMASPGGGSGSGGCDEEAGGGGCGASLKFCGWRRRHLRRAELAQETGGAVVVAGGTGGKGQRDEDRAAGAHLQRDGAGVRRGAAQTASMSVGSSPRVLPWPVRKQLAGMRTRGRLCFGRALSRSSATHQNDEDNKVRGSKHA